MGDHTHEHVLSACHFGRHSMCPKRLTYIAGGDGGVCAYICTRSCHGALKPAAPAQGGESRG